MGQQTQTIVRSGVRRPGLWRKGGDCTPGKLISPWFSNPFRRRLFDRQMGDASRRSHESSSRTLWDVRRTHAELP